MIIRFCANNAWALDLTRRLEKEYPRLRVRSEDCLRKCGICRERPFLVVDGEVMAADTADELHAQVAELIADQSHVR